MENLEQEDEHIENLKISLSILTFLCSAGLILSAMSYYVTEFFVIFIFLFILMLEGLICGILGILILNKVQQSHIKNFQIFLWIFAISYILTTTYPIINSVTGYFNNEPGSLAGIIQIILVISDLAFIFTIGISIYFSSQVMKKSYFFREFK